MELFAACSSVRLQGRILLFSLHGVRDWSLITGRGGGYKTGGGGAREVLPLRKGGGGKSLSHAEGGAQKV